jgi:hypothetical protein
MEFRQYISEGSDGEKDVRKTLKKIPAKHARLVRDYKFVFQPSNCLRGDDRHIGFIDEKNKTITVAAPWNYGREYTLLHEIGHAVWKYGMDDAKRAEWKKLLGPIKRSNKKDLDQNEEELFCMTYAQAYAKNGLEKYDHEELVEFVRGL